MQSSTEPTAAPTTLPSPAPTAARSAPRFYLVGEAERSTRTRPVAAGGRTVIAVNGRSHELRGRTTSFEQLLRIAFPDRTIGNPGLATVAYRHGPASAPEGLLTPGDAIPLTEGLTVNVNATYAS